MALIISHKHKYIYIHPPKTGGTSIQVFFQRAQINKSDLLGADLIGDWNLSSTEAVKELQVHKIAVDKDIKAHSRAKELKKIFKQKGWDWNSYTKIATVRNPFDLYVSRYFYGLEERNDKDLNWVQQSRNATDFNDFIMQRFHKNNMKHFRAFYSAKSFLTERDESTGEDVLLVDHIIKFENLQEDFAKCIKKIQPDYNEPIELEHLNKSNRGHYRNYYNDVTRKICEEYTYPFDFEIGNYTF